MTYFIVIYLEDDRRQTNATFLAYKLFNMVHSYYMNTSGYFSREELLPQIYRLEIRFLIIH